MELRADNLEDGRTHGEAARAPERNMTGGKDGDQGKDKKPW